LIDGVEAECLRRGGLDALEVLGEAHRVLVRVEERERCGRPPGADMNEVGKLIEEAGRAAAAEEKAAARAEREALLNTLRAIDEKLASMAPPALRLTRKGMDSATKARIVQERGAEGYLAIPWE
jgi:hypothetical protein